MPLATICRLGSQEIEVEQATQLRDQAKRQRQERLDFKCIHCGHPVRPHKGGGHAAAHFEHLERNENCPLSHRAPR